MSTLSKIVSGSLASWVIIGIGIVSQIFTVPIYLNAWNVNAYGAWIAIQSIIAIVSTLEKSHQTYIGYELLRIANNDSENLSPTLISAVFLGILLGGIQVIGIALFVFCDNVELILHDFSRVDEKLLSDAGIVLLLLTGASIFAVSAGGVLIRGLYALGYYARMAWWGVLTTLLNTLVPALAVLLGAKFVTTGVVMAITMIACSVPLYIDMAKILKKEGVRLNQYSWQLGLDNFKQALPLFIRDLLDSLRQQGSRILLAPLAGVTALVTFTTLRTGANVVLQGLTTITNPLMPELMRFIHQRDQNRVEAAFSTIWMVLNIFLAPGVIILQLAIVPIFHSWTRGKVPFDPGLFAMLSLGVLVYALAQPALAVVNGNNLSKSQLLISLLTSISLILTMFFFVPLMGVRGAGISLLISEVIACSTYTWTASRWLRGNGLLWPTNSYRITTATVAITGVSLGLLSFSVLPKWAVIIITLILLAFNVRLYWLSLPEIATQQVCKAFSAIKRFRIVPLMR